MITTTTLCLPSLLSPPPAESPSQTHPATLHMPFAHCIFIPVASSSSGDIDGAKVGSFLPALIDSITASVDTPLSPQCAILDTRLLLHPLQLQTAILRTHLALATGKALRTRSLYSELLYNLSPSVNVKISHTQYSIQTLIVEAINRVI